jgi:nitrogen fixation-related uncharacterized protein
MHILLIIGITLAVGIVIGLGIFLWYVNTQLKHLS